MKITLENIGILKHAAIDLSKDLIILAGPNNTGKTYAAYTIYGCYRLMYLHLGVEIFTKNIENKLKGLYVNGNISIDLNQCYLNNKYEYLSEYSNLLKSRLNNIFDTDYVFFNNAKIDISLTDENVKDTILKNNTEYIAKAGSLRIEFQKDTNEYMLIISIINNNDLQYTEHDRLTINDFISYFIPRVILESYFQRSYFFPAERIAINLFSRPLSNNRNNLVTDFISISKNENNNAVDIFSKEKLYPLAIRDSLTISYNLTEYQKKKSDFSNLADIFESEILQGKITVSDIGELQFNPNGIDINPLEIHLSASMVKSLSSLVFYFRHIAQQGDFIIIDEPELNLHPDNQRKIAKLLARIVNAGFKVMISTHSDYIYRELNNQIMLHQDTDMAKGIAAKYGYQPEELLDHNRVGAYLFTASATQMLPMTETGFDIKTIDAEISSLNETQVQ